MASWIVEFTRKAEKEFDTLDSVIQKRILHYLHTRIVEDPKRYGIPLTGGKSDYWRYRIGDYRVVAQLEDDKLLVIILRAAHRKEVYD